MFTNVRGGPVAPDQLSRLFVVLSRRAGLPPVRLHDLRHGAATLSLGAGNDLKVVQAMLGHSSIVLTADTYTSVLPTLAHEAADATARLVLQAESQTTRTFRQRARNRRGTDPASHT